MIKSKGYISKIETMGTLDGPGLRIVIFLEGCSLRCKYCHNPEMWNIKNKEITVEEVISTILKYKNYIINGGVTFSGGEPLYQHDFLLALLTECKKNNIHTCLDTSGVGNYKDILELTDLVIFDIKAVDNLNYQKLTGLNIDKSLEFLSICQKLNKKMWLRQVIIPGINDNIEYINKLKEFIKPLKNIERIELLPYHNIAISKYKELGIKYPLINIPSMDKLKCLELEELLKK